MIDCCGPFSLLTIVVLIYLISLYQLVSAVWTPTTSFLFWYTLKSRILILDFHLNKINLIITVLRARRTGRHFLFLFLTLPVRNTRLFVDLVYFSLAFIIVNLDIVRIEGVNDTPDVEMTEMDLLLTPTLVFGFSLNDKIWCTFWLSQFTRRASYWDVYFFTFLQWSLVLRRSRISNGTKKLSAIFSFLRVMTLYIFFNLSSKLTTDTTTKLALMISSG